MKHLPRFCLALALIALAAAYSLASPPSEVFLGEVSACIPANSRRSIELPTYQGPRRVVGARVEWEIDSWCEYGLESKLHRGELYDPGAPPLISRHEYSMSVATHIRLYSGRDYLTGYGLLTGNIDRDLTAFDGTVDFDRPRPYGGSGFTTAYAQSVTPESSLNQSRAELLARGHAPNWMLPAAPFAQLHSVRELQITVRRDWVFNYEDIPDWSPGHGYVLFIDQGWVDVTARVFVTLE